MPSDGSRCAEVELFDQDPKLLGEAIAAPYRKSSNEKQREGGVPAAESVGASSGATVTYVFTDIPPQLVTNGGVSDKVLLGGDKRKKAAAVATMRKNGTSGKHPVVTEKKSNKESTNGNQ